MLLSSTKRYKPVLRPEMMRHHVLPGDTACPGCPIPIGLKTLAALVGDDAILVVPASCSSVVLGPYPGQSIRTTVVHTAFASAASVASGLRRALDEKGAADKHVIVWAGDGGTADIGMASLSGAAERNENIIYIMYDNEAYMNTGIQRSSSTPPGAWTTTTPQSGKSERKKDVARIMVAHDVPYVATASIAYPHDFFQKLAKALNVKGFRYIQLHAPCPIGWRFPPSKTVEVARLAVETGAWILYEYDQGRFRLTGPSVVVRDPSKRKPLSEYLSLQGRFKGLDEMKISILEENIKENWEWVEMMLSS